MADPHVSLTLTFRTPAAGAVVLQHVLAAVNGSEMPYELTAAHCMSFDMDEVED
ncbi:hypothetical protein ACBJ59_10795 [Nonomuraea sp. MTCD27]|uniref:hypothetical protein n=1 Tax=Nonomuraea sp. MTCD27 TaxID=1676747 RepID=UPI0035C11EB1